MGHQYGRRDVMRKHSIESCNAKRRKQRRRTVKNKGLISKKATLHGQHTFFVHFFAAVLHDEGGGPQVGEVTCGPLPHLTCKRDHI